MNKTLRLFVSSILVTLTISLPQAIYGAESIAQKEPLEMKLYPSHEGLWAPLLKNTDLILEMHISLENLKRPFDKKQQEVLARLFIADFQNRYCAAEFNVEINCKSQTSFTCVLPNKPLLFNSYDQFTYWLKQGCLTTKITITYDFVIDPKKSIPRLAEKLPPTLLEVYHFMGTNVVDSPQIKPDKCVPQATYVSLRSEVNETTVTLGGKYYLNECEYPVENHTQKFPHHIIFDNVLEKDKTKKFYSPKWVAYSEVKTAMFFTEFPRDLLPNWPDAPHGDYSLIRQKLDDFYEIKHVSCWDAQSGDDVNIPDGKVYSIVHEHINGAGFDLASLVKDDDGKQYIVTYNDTNESSEISKKAASTQQETDKEKLVQKKKKHRKKAAHEENPRDPDKVVKRKTRKHRSKRS